MTAALVAAVRGAVGFLSRLPVGRDEAAWDALARTPAAVPLAGYALGALAAVPLLATAVGVPAPTVAVGYVVGVYAVTGINHLDGVADLGDAAVVHGDPSDRREVMKDTALGVGGVLAVGVVVAGLALAGLAIAERAAGGPSAVAAAVRGPGAVPPLRVAVGLVVAAEVAAKLAVATLACLGTATHEGLGSTFARPNGPRDLVPALAVAAPAAALTWPAPAAGAALAGGLAGAAALWAWARARLGGVSGDVFGAANELARLVGLHVGVIAWTLS